MDSLFPVCIHCLEILYFTNRKVSQLALKLLQGILTFSGLFLVKKMNVEKILILTSFDCIRSLITKL